VSTVEDQPPPVTHDGPAMWPLVTRDVEVGFPHLEPERIATVLSDMSERDRVGRARYGTPLQANNGRDPLVDACQELLDGAVYLRQAIVEAPPSPALNMLYRRLLHDVIELRRLMPAR